MAPSLSSVKGSGAAKRLRSMRGASSRRDTTLRQQTGSATAAATDAENAAPRVAYTAGAARFSVVAAAGAAPESAAERGARAVLERLGGTGVLAAIDSAVALRPPQLVFPVASLDDFRGCGRAAAAEPGGGGSGGGGGGGGCLVDAEWVKPGSTVGDLYDAMRRPAGARAPPLVSGEYVRAEGVGSAGVRRVLRKSDLLDAASALVVHVQTNKRRAWQKQAAPPP